MFIPLIPGLGSQRQADLCEFEASLDYIVRSCFKNKYFFISLFIHIFTLEVILVLNKFKESENCNKLKDNTF